MSYFNPETYQADKEAKKSLYISLLFLSVILLGIILGGLYFISKLVIVSKYNEVSEKVVSSKIVEYRGSKGQKFYRPDIVYDYYVDGERYTGNMYDYFNIQKGYELTSDIVRSNTPNKEIKVYVNPNNRFETVLDKDVHPYYFIMLPVISSIFFFWLMTYEMFRTGNYYMLYTKSKNRLVFAYPTAKGFACTVAGISTVICGFYPVISNTDLRWNFFIMWLFVVAMSYYVGYLYKINNLKFSDRMEKMIIESENYKNGGKPVSLLRQKISKKTIFLIIGLFILINIIILTRIGVA